AIGPSYHWEFPVAPDVVECQDHEPDQRLSTPPLVPHLLQEAKHTVGPLHMIVGAYSLADWVVQVGHQLGELLLIQLLHRLDQLRHGLKCRIAHDRSPAATRLVEILGRVEQPVQPIGEPSQRRQLGQVFQHPPQVVMLLFCEVFLTLHDQIPMLEYEVRFLHDRHPAAGCCCLGLAALAVPLLLPPALASPTHGFLHSPHGIQHQLVDVLDDVKDAQLMVRVGPELGDHGGVQVRAVGDHDTRLEPPVLEVLEKPPHVDLIVGCYQGIDVHTPKANVQCTTLDGNPPEISQKSPSNEYHTEHFT